jgi:hypothetical protein
VTLDDKERAARMRAIGDLLDQLQRLVDGAERLERELFDASGSRATWFRTRLDALQTEMARAASTIFELQQVSRADRAATDPVEHSPRRVYPQRLLSRSKPPERSE